jgi:hypothetical protein
VVDSIELNRLSSWSVTGWTVTEGGRKTLRMLFHQYTISGTERPITGTDSSLDTVVVLLKCASASLTRGILE